MGTKASSEPVKPAPSPAPKPVEIGGRGGLDPTRYGDWEVGGIAKDF
jgi:hypothetical protein